MLAAQLLNAYFKDIYVNDPLKWYRVATVVGPVAVLDRYFHFD